MKIAVSGTHVVGKSTLVEALAAALLGYATVEEPYHQLVDEGHDFGDEPSVEDFEVQLERSIADVSARGGDAIFGGICRLTTPQANTGAPAAALALCEVVNRGMFAAMKLLPMLLTIACVAGCGGGDEVDPRCQSLCTIYAPEIEGAGDVCSAASAEQCESDCGARIAGVNTTCASCLLANGCFAPSCDGDDIVFCEGGQCTVTGREGECTYPQGDQEAYEDCEREVNPLREVQCTPEYRPVEECAVVCIEE